MQIAICDDEKVFRNDLKNVLIEYKTEKRIHIDIFEFQSGEDLLKSDKAFDMVFTDYQMSRLNGLDTVRGLRSRNCLCRIIFVTSYPEFVFESFEVQPFRFLVKPIETKKIHEALDAYFAQQKTLRPLIVTENGEQKTVRSEDIIYLEGDGKYCWIRTNKDRIHSSKTISQVFGLLPEYRFFRIHKSYVVNFYCISSFENNALILSNGEAIEISRSRLSEFKKAYMNFVENYYERM